VLFRALAVPPTPVSIRFRGSTVSLTRPHSLLILFRHFRSQSESHSHADTHHAHMHRIFRHPETAMPRPHIACFLRYIATIAHASHAPHAPHAQHMYKSRAHFTPFDYRRTNLCASTDDSRLKTFDSGSHCVLDAIRGQWRTRSASYMLPPPPLHTIKPCIFSLSSLSRLFSFPHRRRKTMDGLMYVHFFVSLTPSQ